MRKRNYHKDYELNRERGYGVDLYRNSRDGKIAGICAGLAEHLDISTWVVRVAFVGAAFMTGGTFIWVYVIAWFLLAAKPEQSSNFKAEFEYDEDEHRYRRKSTFRYHDSARVRLKKAKKRLHVLAKRTGNMEHYVSSRRYDLDKQFSHLSD